MRHPITDIIYARSYCFLPWLTQEIVERPASLHGKIGAKHVGDRVENRFPSSKKAKLVLITWGFYLCFSFIMWWTFNLDTQQYYFHSWSSCKLVFGVHLFSIWALTCNAMILHAFCICVKLINCAVQYATRFLHKSPLFFLCLYNQNPIDKKMWHQWVALGVLIWPFVVYVEKVIAFVL